MAMDRDLSTHDAATPPVAAVPGRGERLVAAVFVAWTLFVWVGRIRNALADPEPAGATILLALSFAVPGVLVGVALVAAWRRGRGWGRVTAFGLAALGVWTVAVWLVRAGDIALGGDWGIGFVVVHLALAIVSIGLAVPTVVAARSALRAEPPPG